MQGNLRKMRVELNNPVNYKLPLGDDQFVELNPHIGNKIRLTHTGEINCVACGRLTKKSYYQGYCYPCMISLAECDICIVKPELCHYFEGTCRDNNWADDHCMQSHYVYLANSSGLKVGITRGSQIPTRWIDQGARQGLPIYKVKNRFMSGLLEIIIKKHMSDRTDWRKMLKGRSELIDLAMRRDEITEICATEIAALEAEHGDDALEFLPDAQEIIIDFPVEQYPEKIKSLNFDKTPEIEGVLMGIKGQYLILDRGVLNIRKFGGYKVGFEIL